jgi:hypothetical protein
MRVVRRETRARGTSSALVEPTGAAIKGAALADNLT